MYTFEVFAITGGFAYEIFKDSTLLHRQEHNPNLDGFIAMTEAQATFIAEGLVNEINASLALEREEPKTAEQIRIEQLEAENADLQLRLADVEVAIIDLFGGAV